MDTAKFQAYLDNLSDDFVQIHSVFSAQVLGFAPGERGVVVNGKILGPFAADEKFSEDDFALLEQYTRRSTAGKIRSKVCLYIFLEGMHLQK